MTLIIDPTSISIPDILVDLKTFVQSKSDWLRWKNFYTSGAGTTFLEMIAALSQHIAFRDFMAVREGSQQDALIRSSNIAIAQGFGYPTYRGKNAHVTATLTPNQTVTLPKFSIVGSCLGYDLVTAEETILVNGVATSLELVVGDLKTETLTASSEDIRIFRFISTSLSEDYQLTLNDVVVPTSRYIFNLLEDSYVVLTNSLNGVDILYKNWPPPSNWLLSHYYTENQHITPDWTWRSTTYTAGDRVTPSTGTYYYECIFGGISGGTEPTWPVGVGLQVLDGAVTWEFKGSAPIEWYFKNTIPGSSASGAIEPIWPMQLGSTVVDNAITWVCTNETSYSLYPYTSGDIFILSYIELVDADYTLSDITFDYGSISNITVVSEYAEEETKDSIKINAPLFSETRRVIRGRNDYSKILKKILVNSFDTNGHDISPAVVELTYVKDHTTELWEDNKLYLIGDKIMPWTVNNYVYEAQTEGYSRPATSGDSAIGEPVWPTTLGLTIADGEVTWECQTKVGAPATWIGSTTYPLTALVEPTVPNTYMYEAIEIDAEPTWPTTIGLTVVDNEVTWECLETIYLGGYSAGYWFPSKTYNTGEYVLPRLSTGYVYIANSTGASDTAEPTWPVVIGNTVVDNAVTWECVNLLNAAVYEKNVALAELLTYRPFGVEPPYGINDPTIVLITLGITLYLTSGITLTSSQISIDLDAILEDYEKYLEQDFDLQDLESLFEALSYVKVARIVISEENKSATWAADTLYELTAVAIPIAPNGYVYHAILMHDLGETGYSQWTTSGYSGATEPVWPVGAGATIVDNVITWTEEVLVPTPDEWVTDTVYDINDIVIPVGGNGHQYKVTAISGPEPVWPTIVDETIIDCEVTWVCKDPAVTPPPLSWCEYFVIRKEITIG